MQNLDIRTLVKECGVQYQSIAKELGVTPVWMSRMMSRPLSVNNKIKILTAINKLKSESKDENEYIASTFVPSSPIRLDHEKQDPDHGSGPKIKR